jgi:predicted RNA-binding Zn ribbon-like protein
MTAEESGRGRALGRRRPREAAAVLEEARRLRRALYRVVQDPTATRDFRTVARLAERSAAAAKLVAGPGRQASWALPVSLALPLLAVARSAAELLCEPDRPRIGRCPGTDCGWLFVNHQGHRRWCTMSICGNRAKARAHARRLREMAGSSPS